MDYMGGNHQEEDPCTLKLILAQVQNEKHEWQAKATHFKAKCDILNELLESRNSEIEKLKHLCTQHNTEAQRCICKRFFSKDHKIVFPQMHTNSCTPIFNSNYIKSQTYVHPPTKARPQTCADINMGAYPNTHHLIQKRTHNNEENNACMSTYAPNYTNTHTGTEFKIQEDTKTHLCEDENTQRGGGSKFHFNNAFIIENKSKYNGQNYGMRYDLELMRIIGLGLNNANDLGFTSEKYLQGYGKSDLYDRFNEGYKKVNSGSNSGFDMGLKNINAGMNIIMKNDEHLNNSYTSENKNKNEENCPYYGDVLLNNIDNTNTSERKYNLNSYMGDRDRIYFDMSGVGELYTLEGREKVYEDVYTSQTDDKKRININLDQCEKLCNINTKYDYQNIKELTEGFKYEDFSILADKMKFDLVNGNILRSKATNGIISNKNRQKDNNENVSEVQILCQQFKQIAKI